MACSTLSQQIRPPQSSICSLPWLWWLVVGELSLDRFEESLDSRGESTLQIRECCLISSVGDGSVDSSVDIRDGSVDVGDGSVDHDAKLVLEMCCSLLY